ncbi:Uncharacterized protein BM_BM14130 [Brugia malayi]|uniref:Bm14130 n=1 Tax=Brugia malayi TaxID=6279 RepID=A0A0J9YA15_BRUMA|nr:Uncharacterized protein BM_BM14130 [Brugia malayi]CDQ05480.1 Bm14130 [Brugia malayi]VIO97231.1 Uncharacterized protein BM_BM14130 [Brugia malayi]
MKFSLSFILFFLMITTSMTLRGALFRSRKAALESIIRANTGRQDFLRFGRTNEKYNDRHLIASALLTPVDLK